ncbi:hypothetical protein C2S53_019325 [Perilla frutescens var. hirtella]|uniref:Uncharacterized protein n=1 Tax=Perilla frutescens var. hirtella TaxID=608512 RepID=A0AAD4JK37_PERFH|nr:hypothetical protein C2S53_019325 [Perilla frutescens var. hirtella]
MVIKGKELRLRLLNDGYDSPYSTPNSRDDSLEWEILLDKKVGVDLEYTGYLWNIHGEEKNAESNRKQREKDDERDNGFYHEEENDPQYELILDRLKEHEMSYMLEYEENGSIVVIKYEGDSCSDRERDQEPKRKLRSAMKQKDGPSSQMPRVENRGMLNSQSTPNTEESKSLNCRQTRNKSNSGKEENAKLSTTKTVSCSTYPHSILALKGDSSLDKDCNLPRRMLRSATKQKNEHVNQMHVYSDDSQYTLSKEMKKLTRRSVRNKSKSEKGEGNTQEPHYHIFLRNFKGVNNHPTYTDGDCVVVYEMRNGESIREKEEHDDGSHSDVEIIDSTAFYKANMSNCSGSTMQSEFRHEVITALRKPFDEEECKKLWHDIELRKREERHLDLRGGRDMSYGKQKDGKSYLDYYPDLRRKLLKVQEDRPKCLNLLRGFFLWLKQPESFLPWLDNECLAIYPESD